MIGGMIMELKIKDPGSALTHFIAMLAAMAAAAPLLVKAASVPGTMHLKALSVFIVSMILLRRKYGLPHLRYLGACQ